MDSVKHTKHRTAWVLVVCSAMITTSAWADKIVEDRSHLLPRDLKQIELFEQSLADYLKENPNAPKLPRLGKVPDNARVQRHVVYIDGDQNVVSTKSTTLNGALNSQVGVAAGEKVVYSNTIYDLSNFFGLIFVRPGAGVRISDDIGTELVDTCGVRRIRFAVNGGVPGGGGFFSIQMRLFDGCPELGGTSVPGSFKFLFGFDNNKAIIHVVDVIFPDPTCIDGLTDTGLTCASTADCSGTEICSTITNPDFFLSLQFTSAQAGWLSGNPAERGFTNDSFSLSGFGCNASNGGFPFFPHGSFFTEISAQDTCETEYLAYQAVSNVAEAAAIGRNNRWAEDLTLALGDQACEISSLEIAFRSVPLQPYSVDVDIRGFAETQGRLNTSMTFNGVGGNDIEIARFRYPPGIFLPSPAYVTFSPDKDGVGIVRPGKTQAGSSLDSFRIIVDDGLGGITWSAPRCIANGLITPQCPQPDDSIFYVRVKCRGDAPLGACCPGQKVPTTCVGGATPGLSCVEDKDCSGGQCMLVDTPCATSADCVLGSECLQTCSGGIHDGLTCFTDGDCVSSSDPTNTGTCVGAKICDRAVCFDNLPVLGCLNGRWQAVNGSASNRCADNPFIPPCGNQACCLPDNNIRDTRFEQCLRIEDPNSPASQCGQCLVAGTPCMPSNMNDCPVGDACVPNDGLCQSGQLCQANGICAPRTAIWHAGRFQGENDFTCPIFECNFGQHDCFQELPEIVCTVPGVFPFVEDDDLCPAGVPCGSTNLFGQCVFGGCENPVCCDRVCRNDSFCCDQIWDAVCVTSAETLCDFVPPGNDDCFCKTCTGVPFRCDKDSDCGFNSDGTPRTCEVNNNVCGSQELIFAEAGTGNACTPDLASCKAFAESTNVAAVTGPDDPIFCCNKRGAVSAEGVIWYRFTMPDVSGATSARFQTCGSVNNTALDSIIQIYEVADSTDRETSCGSLITIGCNDDGGGSCGSDGKLSDTCVEGLVPGTEYFITLASSDAISRGKYLLEVEVPCSLANAPPANNNCAIAELYAQPSAAYDLNNASISCPVVDQCPSFVSDVWFDYIPECTGILTVETCGNGETNLPTAVAVYEVSATDLCPPDPIVDFLNCSESPCATVTVPVNGDALNTVYRIRVGSTATTEPVGTLKLTCTTQDCQPNGVADAIDIANCPVGIPICQDCNSNLIPDLCDVRDCQAGDVTCADCNFNDVPDACDIANGAADMNGNGVPDSCESCTTIPQPVTWTSIGQHGPGCLFDPTCGGVEYGQDMPATSDYSEPRSTGLNKIVVAYDVNVNVSGATVMVTGCASDGNSQALAGIVMSVVAGANPDEAVILFSPSLPGNNPSLGEKPVKYDITISGVTCDDNGQPGQGVITDETRTAWAIFGDANASPIAVNNGDLGFVRSARDIILARPPGMQIVDPNGVTGVFEIRADINNDNTVSNGDLGLVRIARDQVLQPTGLCP